MDSVRRSGSSTGAPVELLDERAPVLAGVTEDSVAVANAVVTKTGRALPAALVAGSLVLALGVWQLVNGPATEALEPEVPLRQVLARHTTSPTVRWETPPKFGGRGGDYSQVSSEPAADSVVSASTFRPGPYR